MTARKDSAKRYGLVGAALVIAAFIVWALVISRLSSDKAADSRQQPLPSSLTEPSKQPQENPVLPTGELAMPR